MCRRAPVSCHLSSALVLESVGLCHSDTCCSVACRTPGPGTSRRCSLRLSRNAKRFRTGTSTSSSAMVCFLRAMSQCVCSRGNAPPVLGKGGWAKRELCLRPAHQRLSLSFCHVLPIPYRREAMYFLLLEGSSDGASARLTRGEPETPPVPPSLPLPRPPQGRFLSSVQCCRRRGEGVEVFLWSQRPRTPADSSRVPIREPPVGGSLQTAVRLCQTSVGMERDVQGRLLGDLTLESRGGPMA